MNIRKLPDSYEEPLSIYVYKIIEFMDSYTKDTFTPNQITITNIFLRIFIIYKLLNNSYDYIPILLIISCILDYLDGYVARKYNMVTATGDVLDHSSDIIFTTVIFVILFIKLKEEYRFIYVIIMIFYFITITLYTGCQQKYNQNNNTEGESLDILGALCYDMNIMNYVKHFGCFSFYIFLSIVVASNKYIFN